MDPEVPIKGVILNRLAGSRHESTVRKSVEYYCNVPVVGGIPKLKNMKFPGRHLGLVPPQEHPESEEALRSASAVMGEYLDTEAIWRIAQEANHVDCSRRDEVEHAEKKVKIGIIRDAAFQFYYPENLKALETVGAELLEFSALKDTLPPSLDALYIGGGFPETHALALAENVKLRREIKEAARRGLPIYAECGGLMYLSRELVLDGKAYPMVDIFPAEIGVSKRPRGHGYTLLEVSQPNPFFMTGKKLRGHEFHYSFLRSMDRGNQCNFAFRVVKGEGIADGREGLHHGNVLATYSHIHALGTPEWAHGMIRAAFAYQEENLSLN
jgi:cobyrinic acid a,c-diamide synthase